ncbi:MAG: DUF1887 family CARF protein [Verrucomicrobiales bacterium]|nr:DUF1887 family CARF protein [Verrucomicrobiales bacterium]
MPSNLLHLVSEQAMQNLLPLLALQPKVVVQVRSKEDRFHQVAENLKGAVAAIRKTAPYRDLAPQFFEVVIDEVSPSVDRARGKVGEALSLWPEAVVNVTGGTKLMSIGAYLAAEYQREPVLYCDTQRRCFVSLNDRCRLPKLPHFDEIAANLDVESVMAAHGVQNTGWTGENPNAELMRFGEQALQCRLSHSDELLEFARRLREDFKPKDRFLSADRFAVRNLEPITAMKTAGVTAYLRAATVLGIITEQADGFRFASGMTRRQFEKAVNLLEGTWLELGVYALLCRNPRFSDVRWNFKPQDQDAAGFGETDIVYVDREITGLALFSCKSIAPRLEHLEALRQRKETLGGRFARVTLCVAHCTEEQKQRLSLWCRALGIALVVGSELVTAFDPDPKS